MKENPMDTGSSHFVISNPNTLAGKNAVIADGRQAGTDDVPSGWLNPINVRTVMHGLNLDSRFRDNYYQTNSSDFTFHLPNPQKKVTNMRIATLDIPMTYHCINRSNGSSTMLILPAPITYDQVNDLKTIVKLSGKPVPNLQNVWTSASDVILKTGLQTGTAGNGAIDYFFNNSPVLQGSGASGAYYEEVYYGTWQGEGKYSVFDLPEPTGENYQQGGLASYRAGWLVIVPDGNYENTFASENEGMDITRAMNGALTRAQPCVVDRGSGTTYILLSKDPMTNNNRNGQGNPVGYVPFINAGLGGKLVFSVDRASGRSTFALPDTQSTAAVIGAGSGGASDFSEVPATPNRESKTVGGNDMIGPSIDDGFELVFAVDSGGNFNPATNIQLRLGWQLGYRIGQYNCRGYYYDPASATHEIKNVYNATSVISEGICMITGPRYMYISIDDGNHNVGSNFTAIFSESTLGEHIMTRINLASTMDSTGVFKCASDAGLSNQLNRTREYFGPVDISRLKIKLMDEYGRIINFNNMDWSMSMVFEKLYD